MTSSFACALELTALARLMARFEALPRIARRNHPVQMELSRQSSGLLVVFRDTSPALSIAGLEFELSAEKITLNNCQGPYFSVTYCTLEELDPIIERTIETVVKHFSYTYHYA